MTMSLNHISRIRTKD